MLIFIDMDNDIKLDINTDFDIDIVIGITQLTTGNKSRQGTVSRLTEYEVHSRYFFLFSVPLRPDPDFPAMAVVISESRLKRLPPYPTQLSSDFGVLIGAGRPALAAGNPRLDLVRPILDLHSKSRPHDATQGSAVDSTTRRGVGA
jgi:hypothetical protein